MKLSIIIVSYNVKHLLEQCLHSVYAACKHIESEVFVVDNNSIDDSCAMIRSVFPEVRCIENKKNVGFSKANNQAILLAQGEYIVLLNPDTLVQEDTFEKMIAFADKTPDVGAVGVRMISGDGKFLPESKRGLPTAWVSLSKMIGLHKVFPKSKRYNYYFLGHLSEHETHEVDVLSGACMLVKKSVFEDVGLLDEDYFMYGEDIDLSYRISKAGYKNYYVPETTIIHYKGASTKKQSFVYVQIFYKAMAIFAKKQLHIRPWSLYALCIHTAIAIFAGIAFLLRIVKRMLFPTLDFALILTGFYVLATWWGAYVFGIHYSYPDHFFMVIAPLFTLLWLLSIYVSGGYENPVRAAHVLQGISVGFIAILLLYALLPESMRYSRALLILGFVWNIIVLVGLRILVHFLPGSPFSLVLPGKAKSLLVGTQTDVLRMYDILQKNGSAQHCIGFVSSSSPFSHNLYKGTLSQLRHCIEEHQVDEVIFCLQNAESRTIIQTISSLANTSVDIKIAPPESYILSHASLLQTSGILTCNLNSIAKPLNRQKKRLFDIVSSAILLCTSVLWLWFVPNKSAHLKACYVVFLGRYTWVGYSEYFRQYASQEQLPFVKQSCISPAMHLDPETHKTSIIDAHYVYIKNYRIRYDIELLYRYFMNIPC